MSQPGTPYGQCWRGLGLLVDERETLKTSSWPGKAGESGRKLPQLSYFSREIMRVYRICGMICVVPRRLQAEELTQYTLRSMLARVEAAGGRGGREKPPANLNWYTLWSMLMGWMGKCNASARLCRLRLF